jgi:hypothetical protein
VTGPGLSRVFDASIPPATAPPGCTGVLGYVGRAGRTPHVWTLTEWERFRHLVQFPCWVPDLSSHPGHEAAAIISALKVAGWPPHGGALAPVVVIDYETAGGGEATWHSGLADELGRTGYNPVAYGSESTVMQIGASHVWVAAWDGKAVLEPGAMTVVAHQYTDNVAVDGTWLDYSACDTWLMDRGLRRA